MADITQAIIDAANNPKKAQGDVGSAEAHSLPDMVSTQRFLQAQVAATGPKRGIRLTRLIPPGTVMDPPPGGD